MEEYGIDAVPMAHEMLDKWRDSLRGGIQYLHAPTNLKITGGVDDVWINPKGEFIIVDYKATSKEEEVSLDAKWQDGYKHQMEIYQWLFKKNGHKVNKTGYFVYCNGKTDKEAFDAKLEFDIKIIPYEGNTDWVEDTIKVAHQCLMSDNIPECNPDCDFCLYRTIAQEAESVFSVETIISQKVNKASWFTHINPANWIPKGKS
ncbi:MAG: PD-(D/E)XK nuclease family protein [Patescibacteria group bacterium]|nr:PD-(D/E)XK nuclease family protein [Patescibacteria group bacterium]